MKKGDVTPDTLGMIVITIGLIILGFLMFMKVTKSFIEGFAASSAKVVAMDLSSLTSLSLAAEEVKIEYEVPTETVEFIVKANGYIRVQRMDDTYCKEEERPLIKKVIGEEPISEDEFCKALEPVLFTPVIGKDRGRKFVIRKVEDGVELYAE